MAKVSFDTIKKLYSNENREILGVSIRKVGKLNKNTTYINYRCLIDNYEGFMSIGNMKSGYGCPKCGGTLALNIEEIKEKLKYINKDIEILSKENINSKTKLKCKCLIHGNEFEMLLGNLLKGKGCSICGRVKVSESKRIDISKIKEILSKKGYEFKYVEYKNSKNYVMATDDVGYKLYSNLSGFKNNKHGRKFDKSNPYTIYNIRLWLSKNNPNIELLSEIYLGAKTEMICKCRLDGNIFKINLSNLQRMHGCQECVARKSKKENNPNWKGGITNLNQYLRGIIKEWKKNSFIEYGYECDITHINKNLVIHHIVPFSKITKEVLYNLNYSILENIGHYSKCELNLIEKECIRLHEYYGLGVCLCKEEHDLFHGIYGKYNNNLEQYLEFKLSREKLRVKN